MLILYSHTILLYCIYYTLIKKIYDPTSYFTLRLFRSFEFGNGSRMSDKTLPYLNLNISRTKNGRNKL